MHFTSLQELQAHLQSFTDPAELAIAESAPFLAASQDPQRKHIVVLLHGMNTNAEWQEALAESMRNCPELEPAVVGYGNFHPVKFWLPSVYRRGRIKKVLTDLRGIRARNQSADISIVAHSFGTYIVAKILSSNCDVKLHRVLLCGAIVETDFDWSAVSAQFIEPVINDTGRRDIWPSLAKSWSWGFGDSGVIGFKNSLVRDRHFTYEHSGFLNIRHMRRYWLPFLIDGKVVPSRFTSLRKAMCMREKLVRAMSWKYVIALVGMWAVVHYDVVPRLFHWCVNLLRVGVIA